MPRDPAQPTATHYALLCLLSIGDATAYELVRLTSRSIGAVWPRAESNLYAGLDKLAALGWATTEKVRQGRRTSTVYRITPDGTAALRSWLAEPGAMPTLECEALLKVGFAPQASKAAVLAQIDALAAHAEVRLAFGEQLARENLSGEAGLPERLHINAVMWRFLRAQDEALAGWARWARDEVASWPDTKDSPAMRRRGRKVLENALSGGA